MLAEARFETSLWQIESAKDFPSGARPIPHRQRRTHQPDARLEALLRHAFGHGAAVEIRVRSWADSNADAARAVGEVDRRRRDYLEQLLIEAGVAPKAAERRAQLLYWSYLGAALSRSMLAGERLNEFVSELKRIDLGEQADRFSRREAPGESVRMILGARRY